MLYGDWWGDCPHFHSNTCNNLLTHLQRPCWASWGQGRTGRPCTPLSRPGPDRFQGPAISSALTALSARLPLWWPYGALWSTPCGERSGKKRFDPVMFWINYCLKPQRPKRNLKWFLSETPKGSSDLLFFMKPSGILLYLEKSLMILNKSHDLIGMSVSLQVSFLTRTF